MKFQFKVLVATLALAVTLPASAAMTDTQSGNSSLMLTLLDNTAGISATFDLGYSKGTFNQIANNSWTMNSGDYASAWTSFWNVATAGNTSYAVFAGDALGVGNAEQSIFTTVASTWTGISNTVLGTSQANFDGYMRANSNSLTLGNMTSVVNGASVATSLDGAAYAGKSLAYGGSATSSVHKIASVGGDTSGLIGTNLSVFNIVRNGTSGLTTSTATKLSVAGPLLANGTNNPYFNMSSTGALTYVAAVPEADTSAMMLAGLGLMGFIARRRRNNVA
jgi:hypothetical protein